MVRARFALGATLVSAALVAAGSVGSAAQSPPPHMQAEAVRVTAASSSVNWTQYHGAPTHEGFNQAEHKIGTRTVSQLGLSWIGNGATNVDDLVTGSSATVVDGFAYFGTFAGQLLAFPAHCSTNCDPAWRLQLGASILNTPAVVDGTLYVGTVSDEGRLWAFDVKTCANDDGSCSPLWTADISVGNSSPTVVDGVVYVGSNSGNVYAFDAKGCERSTCQPLWVGHTDGSVLNSPAVFHGMVYAGDSTGFLYAFDAAQCARQSAPARSAPVARAVTCGATWQGQASGPILDSSPVVRGGMVYTTSFGASPNSFLEVYGANGCGAKLCQPLWQGTGGAFLNGAPAVAYGHVYLGDGHGTMLVYPAKGCGASTCAPQWQDWGGGSLEAVTSPPMVANGVVYIGMDQRLRAFDARGCGQQLCDPLWEFAPQDPIVDSSPVMVNHTLYFAGNNGGQVPELYVFTRLKGKRG